MKKPDLKNPFAAFKTLGKNQKIAVVAGAVGIAGLFYYYSKKKSAASAAASSGGSAATTTSGDDTDDTGASAIDPSTGVPYAQEADDATDYGDQVDPDTGQPYDDDYAAGEAAGEAQGSTAGGTSGSGSAGGGTPDDFDPNDFANSLGTAIAAGITSGESANGGSSNDGSTTGGSSGAKPSGKSDTGTGGGVPKTNANAHLHPNLRTNTAAGNPRKGQSYTTSVDKNGNTVHTYKQVVSPKAKTPAGKHEIVLAKKPAPKKKTTAKRK